MTDILPTSVLEQIDITPIYFHLDLLSEESTLSERESYLLKASLALVDTELQQDDFTDAALFLVACTPLISPAKRLHALNDSLRSRGFIDDGEFIILRAGICLLSIELSVDDPHELGALIDEI